MSYNFQFISENTKQKKNFKNKTIGDYLNNQEFNTKNSYLYDKNSNNEKKEQMNKNVCINNNDFDNSNSLNVSKRKKESIKRLEKNKFNFNKLKMKEIPEMERPYEKLKMFGPERLSNAELLAIIIKTGTKNETALDLSNKVLKMANSLDELHNLSITELKQIGGIGDVKAIEIMAVCELTRRMSHFNNSMKIQIKSPEDVFKLFSEEYMFKKNEIIKAVVLNIKNIVVKVKDIAVGDANCSHVTMKMILSENVRLQEPKLILIHNHPSGNPEPSQSDIELTKRLYDASKLMGVDLLDHIVIGNGNYKSIFSICKFGG